MKLLAPLVLTLALAACASSPTVDTDSAPGVNLAQYNTYSWLSKPNSGNPLVDQRIVSDVDAQLAQRGWKISDNAQTAVVANVASQQKQTLNTFYDGPAWGGWGWRGVGMAGMGNATTTVSTYDVGTLVVDIFDASTKQAIWRGTASATVPSSSSAVNSTIDASIVKMFAGFAAPPAPAK